MEALSRPRLLAAVVDTLRSIGLHLRPSATIDGMFALEATML